MEIELDESSLKVLKCMFDWSDVDGDGVISRKDLKICSGVQNDSELNSIFTALKKSGGGDTNQDGISYPEFCKGIMDFPLLLEQFRSEFLVKQPRFKMDFTEEGEKSLNAHDPEEPKDRDLAFIVPGLQDAVSLYAKSLNLEAFALKSDSRDELLESMRLSLERLRTKYKGESESHILLLINGSIELYLLVRDLTRYHEEVCADLKTELWEYQANLVEVSAKYEAVADENERIMAYLESIENQARKTTDAHAEILHQKNLLLHKLEKAEDKERVFQQQLGNIQTIILGKERAIMELERDLRQLTSLRTIQEMKDNSGRTTEDMRKMRSTRLSDRQSMPINQMTSTQKSIPYSPRADINKQILKSQLQYKDEQLKALEALVTDMEFQTEKCLQENEKVRAENMILIDKFRRMEMYVPANSVDSRESFPIPSLYDELRIMRNDSTVEGKSISYDRSILVQMDKSPYEPRLKCTVATQTIHPVFLPDKISPSTGSDKTRDAVSEKKRNCFGCL